MRLRTGLSLDEMLAVVAHLGIVWTLLGATIVEQQRFHRNASELLSARQGVRDAMEVMSADIRGSSTEDTVRAMADSAVELFASIGASVACRPISGGSIALARESARGNTLTSFLVFPDTGDLALVYRKGAEAVGGAWERYRISSLTTRSGDPDCLGGGADDGEGYVLTLQSLPAEPVTRGSPVRFIRRGRYSLYRSSDAQWNLGYRRCNALGPSACGSIQPVSGPYRRYSSDRAQTGFLLEYFDAEGARVEGTGSVLSIARVDATARADRSQRRTDPEAAAETAAVSIAIRNR